MSWQVWVEELRQTPHSAVADLLRGAADVSPFERITAHEFLLAVLPRGSRLVANTLLGEPITGAHEPDSGADLPGLLDVGLADWFLARRLEPFPAARKLSAYVVQVCEALQWPIYFKLPRVRAALRTDRALWIKWLGALNLSAYRDPEHEYWRVLAAEQADDRLQFFWQSFVAEAGRSRSERYLNLGLLALAKLPLSDEDSLRNLRLQVQALVNRYQLRKAWGTPALEQLAQELRGVMTRNPSLGADNYRKFLTAMLTPLGEDKTLSVLSLLGMSTRVVRESRRAVEPRFRLEPPGKTHETDEAVRAVRQSLSLAQAWNAVHRLLSAHEDHMRRSGDPYFFVRNLDRCGRALCDKYALLDSEVRERLLQWICLALRIDAEDSRLWLLWELVLRKAGQTQRAQWVLWEMTQRFPENLPCRVELARMLASSEDPGDRAEAQRLLRQVLLMDPEHLHAFSTIAQLAIRRGDWVEAFEFAQKGLRVDPSNESCAVLQAKAYASRDEPGDLQTAIDLLKRFVERYPGNLTAERNLGKLLQRQESTDEGIRWEFDDLESQVAGTPASTEMDPAWRAFADSLEARADVPSDQFNDRAEAIDRVLPLPQVLRSAVLRERWEVDVLQEYDVGTQREFPLETRLWRYLRTLHRSDPSLGDRRRAEEELEAWIKSEERTAGQGSEFWLDYIRKHWATVAGGTDVAVKAGAEWLNELLARYRPLPAPLLG